MVVKEKVKTESPLDILATSEQSPLAILANSITHYWAESENAEEIAKQAMYSALDSARLCGEALLEAKKNVVHGKWEEFRENLKHPITGKSMPSSTATLYQRIAFRWSELQEAEAKTLREAAELLKKPRQQGLSNQEKLERHIEQTKHLLEDPQSVADLPKASIDSSEHLDITPSISEEAPSISPDYGENVSDEIAESLTSLGVMPCKPSITPEEFNREMAKANLAAPSIRIINPKLKQCEFVSNGKLVKGTVSGVLFDWKRMTVAAVLIDYDDGKQIKLPASKVWLIDEGDSESNDQPINRFAGIEELESKGWHWSAHRSDAKTTEFDYWYFLHITSPDAKHVFFAQRYEALEDALENCIEQAKEAGVWED